MKLFDTQLTRDALAFERLVPALRQMFVDGCEVPQRHVHTVPGAQGEMTVLIMPAWVPGRYLGIKTINIAPGNARRGLPGLHASYALYDATTGVPLAQIDGSELTARRTAAVSALAASMLARPGARRLLVVGAGRVAALLPLAYRSVMTLDEVCVWARRADAAEALAAAWRAQGLAARAVTDLAQAVTQADLVSCATLATEPVVRGEWLQPGSHLDLIGSFTPQMREADDACFRGAQIVVDTEEAWHKSGELLGPVSRGVLSPQGGRGTLTQLCRGEFVRGTDVRQRTVFKSVGYALEDLAAAILVVESTAASRR
ncbi:MAG: ornithine cyclodeaminase family protein [Rhizobacter sp.]|nr:ornithine cyclodeaminase family protein [Rhizobacter sp.]